MNERVRQRAFQNQGVKSSLRHSSQPKRVNVSYSSNNSGGGFRPIFALILIFLTFALIYFIWFFANSISTPVGETRVRRASGERVESWWNEEYAAFTKVTVKNTSSKYIPVNQVVSVNLEHQKFVTDKLSSPSGNDMRLVYLDSDNRYVSVDFTAENLNTSASILKFKLIYDIPANGSDDFYYLYFGNFQKPEPFKLAGKLSEVEKSSYEAHIAETTRHPLLPSISRRWLILGGSTVPDSYKSSEIRFKITDSKVKNPTLRLLNQYSSTLRDVKMAIEPTTNDYVYRFTQNDFAPGDYNFRIVGEIDGQQRMSPRQQFFVSYPLYVNWSIDWEGYGIEDRWLNLLAKVGSDYNVPMTHYFNPRVFLSEPTRAKNVYVKFVLDRQKQYGDEIGMHLHMWNDMVAAAGVTPRNDISWDGGTSGYDTATTTYTPEEFDKIVKWGKAQFAANGLPVPKTYRAGGWQINSRQLQVLPNNGFLLDSSGRNFIKHGSKSLAVPWFLSATTKPYKPSLSDQNTSGSDSINIWEFPNNGENTSNYGPNNNVVFDAYRLNFSGSALKERQVLSVLSHVQLFHNDDPVIRRYLTEQQKSLAEKDLGPIMYSTLERLIPEFEKGLR